MTRQLLLANVGPVQEFIAQARRSRDLWFGSHLLSELARAMVKRLLDAGAEVVFPAIDSREAQPQQGPLDAQHRPVAPLPNHVLAIVPHGVDPATLSHELREAASRRLRSAADVVRNEFHGIIEASDALWDEQIGTLTEYHAAWAPMTDEDDYQRVRRLLESALASRRNLRNFAPWEHDRVGAPKSSLDGARVSVLKSSGRTNSGAWRQLRLGRGEQLDAVGLLKRVGGDPDQFVPLANVAAASWMERLRSRSPESLRAVADACRAAGIGRVRNPSQPWVAWPGLDHGYDAEVFYEGRWPSLFQESGGDEQGAASWGKQNIAPLYKGVGRPTPYVACIAADGDHVGAALDALRKPAAHRAFSASLAKFASSCHEIFAAHHGLLIYSGGDDVLGFVGVERAVALADALRNLFAKSLSGALPLDTTAPTLSVGVGVGHLMDGMANLLQLGRAALQVAKGDQRIPANQRRNALGILVDKRSGGTNRWRARWDSGQPAEVLGGIAGMLGDRRLPRGKIYEVAAVLRRFPDGGVTSGEDAQWQLALAGEVERVLMRAHGDQGLTAAQAGLSMDRTTYGTLRASIGEWIERCRIAFAMATKETEIQV